jgi:hypothetical protein
VVGRSTCDYFPELVETVPQIDGPVSEPFGEFGAAIYLVRLSRRDARERIVDVIDMCGNETWRGRAND